MFNYSLLENMKNEILKINEEWYEAMIEDCRAIATETLFNSQMALIEGKHAIGERICMDPHFKKMAGSKKATLKGIFRDIGLSNSDGYYCVSFYEKYPNLSKGLDSFPDQKNISWKKIITSLPVVRGGAIVDNSQCKHEDYYVLKVCRTCGRKEQVK